MKKLTAFVVILSLGLFCAVGCSKPAPAKKAGEKDKAPAAAKDDKAPKTDEKAAPAKEEPKADEKKDEKKETK